MGPATAPRRQAVWIAQECPLRVMCDRANARRNPAMSAVRPIATKYVAAPRKRRSANRDHPPTEFSRTQCPHMFSLHLHFSPFSREQPCLLRSFGSFTNANSDNIYFT